MQSFTDTIVAQITPPGVGAVSVVRLSGPAAYQIASRVFSPWPDWPEARKALYGRFVHGDDGLALPFPQGASFTGEQTVELSTHGSPASVTSLIRACIAAGARQAEPGEFTLRAFMNGKIDLTQAEGVRETVDSLTDSQLRQANLLRMGAVAEKIGEIRHEVIGVLAAVEASTDFSEEVGDLDRPQALTRLDGIQAQIDRLLSTENASKLLRQGRTIALVGLPNAGKSSLFNALLGMDRAIVTPIPGTTRDTVEEVLSIHGVPTRLIDTAGLRETGDLVEKIGVERSLAAAQNADLVWYLYDSGAGWQAEDDQLVAQITRPLTLIANKSDLGPGPKGVPVSAKTGSGLAELLETLALEEVSSEIPFLIHRHYDLLREAKRAISEVQETIQAPIPTDLAAVGLRSALRTLGEMTGESTPPDVLERIFQDFCIGK